MKYVCFCDKMSISVIFVVASMYDTCHFFVCLIFIHFTLFWSGEFEFSYRFFLSLSLSFASCQIQIFMIILQLHKRMSFNAIEINSKPRKTCVNKHMVDRTWFGTSSNCVKSITIILYL